MVGPTFAKHFCFVILCFVRILFRKKNTIIIIIIIALLQVLKHFAFLLFGNTIYIPKYNIKMP